jgi:hypothetical protein
MNVDSVHHKYVPFVKNELKTLNFIASNPTISSRFKNLSLHAKQVYDKFIGYKDRDILTKDFDFGTDFDIEIDKKNRRIVVECILTTEYRLASYALTICKKNVSPYAVVRKFHFDYAIPNNQETQPKPVYHIQYGGEVTPKLASLKISVDHLNPWLSSPRIFSVPMTLALLLDLVFCEFRTADTIKITDDGRWRDLIVQNERFLLTPYFSNFLNFVENRHKANFLIRDFNYGHPRQNS